MAVAFRFKLRDLKYTKVSTATISIYAPKQGG